MEGRGLYRNQNGVFADILKIINFRNELSLFENLIENISKPIPLFVLFLICVQ